MNRLIKNNFIKKNIIKIFDLIKNNYKYKFIESIDIAINLYNKKKNNFNILGSVILPNNCFNKKRKIIVFAPKSKYKLAISCGAYFVGQKDLFNLIKDNKIDYDVVISTPELLYMVNKLNQILGPKGLIPSIELGTVTNNLKNTINNFISGKILYKSDKFGIIHTIIGKINFTSLQLYENFIFLIKSIFNLLDKYNGYLNLKKITVSSTMGKGYLINLK